MIQDQTSLRDGTTLRDASAELASIEEAHSTTVWLTFSSMPLEKSYRQWRHSVYRRDLRMGLLVTNFLCFVVSIAFSVWSGGYVPSTVGKNKLMLVDAAMGVSLTVCFACAFSPWSARHPQIFSSLAMLLSVVFIVFRAALLKDFAAVAPVVLLVLNIFFLLGSTLLRLPFLATLLVGMAVLAIYSGLALTELLWSHGIGTDGSAWYPVGLFAVVLVTAIAAGQRERATRNLFLMQLASRSSDGLRHLHGVAELSSPRPGRSPRGGPHRAHSPRPMPLSPSRSRENHTTSTSSRTDPLRFSFLDASPMSHGTPLRPRVMNAAIPRNNSAPDLICGVLAASPSHASLQATPPRLAPRRSAHALDSLSTVLREAVVELVGSLNGQNTTQGTSIEAVQNALHESGASSLREFLANALSERLPNVPWTSHASPRNVQRPPHVPILQPQRRRFALITQDELPAWFTPYPYIVTSYRCDFTYRLALCSLFRIHNETINVWTELAPALGFCAWSVIFLSKPQFAELPAEDRAFVTVGLICCSVVRPICSGFAHLLHCTSASGYIFWWSVDYFSIAAAILASSLVSARFAFYCDVPLQVLFFTSSAGLLCTSIVAVLAVASPALRAASFLLFVIFCNGVPLVYQVAVKFAKGNSHMDVPPLYLQYWGASLGTFLLGLIIKFAMMPEKVLVNRWADIWLNSHQLWHVCIHAGFVLGTFQAWDVYLEWRIGHECPAPP